MPLKQMSLILRIAVTAVISSALVAAGSGAASAAPNDIDQPKSTLSAPSAAETTLETEPGTTKVIDTDSEAGDLSVEIPGNATKEQLVRASDIPAALFEGEGKALINTELPDAAISTFATDSGLQSIIKIDSPTAAKEYRFTLEVPEGASATVLQDGSIEFLNADASFLGSVQVPWARDANGVAVPTSFAMDGMTLVQTINHSDITAFPVVADPSTVWGWAVCVAIVGSTILPWGAAARIAVRIIARFGNVARGIEIIYRAYHAANGTQAKWNAAMAASGGLFAEIVGINAIKDSCFR